jgi:hypothetical protein
LDSLCSPESEHRFIIAIAELQRKIKKIVRGTVRDGCSLMHSQGAESSSRKLAVGVWSVAEREPPYGEGGSVSGKKKSLECMEKLRTLCSL